MLDIADVKTRDAAIINQTITEILNLSATKKNPINDTNLLFDCIEKIPTKTNFFFNKDTEQWVFTNCFDDYLCIQNHFSRGNFVVVERDPNLALGRGIHYSYHKKIRN